MPQSESSEIIRSREVELEIDENYMPNPMTENAVLWVKEAFAQCDSFRDIAIYVQSKCDEKYSKRWHCFVYLKGHGSYNIYFSYGGYIKMTLGKIAITIFRTDAV